MVHSEQIFLHYLFPNFFLKTAIATAWVPFASHIQYHLPQSMVRVLVAYSYRAESHGLLNQAMTVFFGFFFKGNHIPSRKKNNVDIDIIVVLQGEERSKKTISN